MKTTAFCLLLAPVLALGVPPGAPLSDLGPSQVSLGLFFDHSGQDLSEEIFPSMLNTMGLSAEYAPWPYVAFGIFAGAAEFDVDVPDDRTNDTASKGFNSGLSFSGGGSLKLSTPHFLSGTTRFVAHGTAAYFNATDDFENEKRGIMTNTGLTLQVLAWGRVNFVLGGEFQALLEGEQRSAIRDDPEPFGLSAPVGPVDYLRGLAGIEYYFPGKNRPFISIAVRPTGVSGWHDHLGLRNASVSVTLGAITTLLSNGKNQVQEEEPGLSID